VGTTISEATGSFLVLIACSFLNKLDVSGILSTEVIPPFYRVIKIYPHMIQNKTYNGCSPYKITGTVEIKMQITWPVIKTRDITVWKPTAWWTFLGE
jgi:hypothetical protein